ncbi:hypothetical protein FA10DRAFT_16032 [Acaromyces ingoldii]|uniref:DUF7704 domain-containing protein n=1 Tax=Acaromyces ingoldii TaxID=215250 RepID=A0A316YZG3_9BASI|nr:hypothetical protein FA10DRAFT_16032 [Acaromyces ingoldii]PWN93205.1 hypothetical protein FA10DRAFT_16032 [Acaromyces ingoldii]
MAIPTFYRVVFFLFDVAMPLFGVVANTTMPEFIVSAYTPKIAKPIATETIVLLDGMAGFFACLIFLNLYFLSTKANDVTVWRGLQGGTLLTDVFMLFAFGRALSTEGRTTLESWRGEDYGNVVGYTVILLVRLAFVLGLGLKEEQRPQSEKKKA